MSVPNVYDTTYVASGPGHVGSSSSASPSPAVSFDAPATAPLRSVASDVDHIASYDFSDLGDSIRDMLSQYASSAQSLAAQNTALSQEFAREQMRYQSESDQRAMSFSAQQAQANRDWQERLSDSAHQREVKDLLAAGLNPILSANAGAYTGSGATASGFSSSGAQGSVDTSASGLLGQLIASSVSSASQAAITKMYTDASRYQADMQYASSKMATEASIMNNNNSVSAQKAINALNSQTEIQRANIAAGATLGAAGSAAAASRYVADKAFESKQYEIEHSIQKDPVTYITNTLPEVTLQFGNKMSDVLESLGTKLNGGEPLPKDPFYDGISGATPSYNDYHYGKSSSRGR